MTPKLKAVPDTTGAGLDQVIADWSADVLACRSLQHAWTQQHASYSERYRYFSVSYECTRCSTVKHQELNARGLVTGSWYEYPDGYLSTYGALSSEDRGLVRMANLEAHHLNTVKVGSPPQRGRKKGTT